MLETSEKDFPKVVRVEPTGGDRIDDLARKMINLANCCNIKVKCEFNGVEFSIIAGMKVNQITEMYWAKLGVKRKKR